jgi:hypothetical protein
MECGLRSGRSLLVQSSILQPESLRDPRFGGVEQYVLYSDCLRKFSAHRWSHIKAYPVNKRKNVD